MFESQKINEQDNFTLLFQTSPIGMILLNEDVTISEINNAALRLIDKSYEDAVGKAFGDAFDCIGSFEDERGCGFGANCSICIFQKAVTSAIKDGIKSEGLEFNKTLVQGDKKVEVWFRSSITPITIQDRNQVSVALVDITDSKQKEFSLIKAKQAAEAANRVKSEFLANMSHEIRTPLNGMIGMIDLTLLSGLNTEQKENLLTAKSCANSLLHMINDVLDFSKLEAEKLVIETVDFNLKSLIEETIKAHSPLATNKGLELTYSFSANIPLYLKGDPTRLKQVLNNLISNAIKFTERGSVTVTVKHRGDANDGAGLQFDVADTGIGISKEEMGKLFQTFSQVDGSITRKFGGTGLGLAISKQLVELMGGTIWAESRKGKGSHFTFALDFKLASQQQKAGSQTITSNKEAHTMNILLVEDNNIAQKILTRMLKEKGHIVEIANNGLEALKLHGTKKYDTILMDIYMPEMDGIEATRRIREREGFAEHTPIIAVTADALHKEKEHFLTLGMDEYLAKPIDMDELFALLDQVQGGKSPSHVSVAEEIQPRELRQFSSDQNLRIINYVEGQINTLKDAIIEKNFSVVEISAHKIKEIANRISAEELKSTAFKIELSAKRGALLEAAEYIQQIEYEFETLKRSVNS
jgi:signal transduction histidine kinase/CheY-like chemotaxis protein